MYSFLPGVGELSTWSISNSRPYCELVPRGPNNASNSSVAWIDPTFAGRSHGFESILLRAGGVSRAENVDLPIPSAILP